MRPRRNLAQLNESGEPQQESVLDNSPKSGPGRVAMISNTPASESCACDDCPNSIQAQGRNLRCNQPHTGNQDEEKSDFGNVCPRRRAELRTNAGSEVRRGDATFALLSPERPAK